MSLIRGAGLSPADQEKLDKWIYDEQANRMSTDASVRSGLNSFELGEMHTTHSGGENVFDQNNVSKINWFPVWQGVKPFTTGAGEHVGFNPTVRQYSNLFEITPNGATADSTSVVYTDTITLTDNESVVRLIVQAGEDYAGTLAYQIKDNDANGVVKYQQFLDVDVLNGDVIEFLFTHPSESRSGDVIYVDIMKDDNSSFLVRKSTTSAKAYLKLLLATYKDVDVVSATQFITEGFTVRYAGDYECDTTAGGFTITVPADFKQTFYVSDANQSFKPSSPCTVDFSNFGQGQAVLQTARDAYKFYWDENGNQWRFKDLDTKNGGVV